MSVVIDAQVVHAYYCETVHAADPACTASTVDLIHSLSQNPVFLDSGGQIENEWRSVVDRTWFDAWYGELLIRGDAYLVDTATCQRLLKVLRDDYGFPVNTGDKWYIRTAKAVADGGAGCLLVTEDMDFHDPRRKGCSSQQRSRVFSDGTGRMARFLERAENIRVRCVASAAA